MNVRIEELPERYAMNDDSLYLMQEVWERFQDRKEKKIGSNKLLEFMDEYTK